MFLISALIAVALIAIVSASLESAVRPRQEPATRAGGVCIRSRRRSFTTVPLPTQTLSNIEEPATIPDTVPSLDPTTLLATETVLNTSSIPDDLSTDTGSVGLDLSASADLSADPSTDPSTDTELFTLPSPVTITNIVSDTLVFPTFTGSIPIEISLTTGFCNSICFDNINACDIWFGGCTTLCPDDPFPVFSVPPCPSTFSATTTPAPDIQDCFVEAQLATIWCNPALAEGEFGVESPSEYLLPTTFCSGFAPSSSPLRDFVDCGRTTDGAGALPTELAPPVFGIAVA